MRIVIIQSSDDSAKEALLAALGRTNLEAAVFEQKGGLPLPEEISGFILLEALSDLEMLKILNEMGKPILGLGEGATYLVNAGLVPGIHQYAVGCRVRPLEKIASSMRLAEDYQLNAFTRYFNPRDICLLEPSEKAVCFDIPPGLLKEMEIQGLNLFQYCNAKGEVEAPGSILGVSNKAGNVLALLPAIEKTAWIDPLLRSMQAYIENGHAAVVAPLHYFPRKQG